MTTHQLIYTSRKSLKMTHEELLDMLLKAQEANYQLKLSGVLILQKGMFLQLLEGGEKEVKDMFEKIKRDIRHTDVNLVLESDSAERCLPMWAMGACVDDSTGKEISKQSCHFSIEEIREITSSIEGDVGQKIFQFLE